VANSEEQASEVTLSLLESVPRAAQAIDVLIAGGCPPSDIGLLMTDRTAERAFGRADDRDSDGATSTFSGDVHSLAAALQPLAPFGAGGIGLVAAGPLAALVDSAGLGSDGGLEQGLAELGMTRDAADVAQRVLQGAVLVSAPVFDDSELFRAFVAQSAMFWRVPLTAPLTTSAVVIEPLAAAVERSARYRPVIEGSGDVRR
jgi:hypothetical protein